MRAFLVLATQVMILFVCNLPLPKISTMTISRKISRVIRGQLAMDGAGVKLRRIFGFQEEGLFDPFLLLDFFGSDNPKEYMAGFPWHPHRGMETVTYMLEGKVEHADSLGNKGIIGTGDLQWMTAGSGIIHQEMPLSDSQRMYGFQLWVNLPANAKMMKPRYQEIKAADIPSVEPGEHVKVKVIAGSFQGIRGPVEEIVADPLYLDIQLAAHTSFSVPVSAGHTAFGFVFEGEAYLDTTRKEPVRAGEVALYEEGEQVDIRTSSLPARMLLVAGKPLHEPVAWRGPIVMNTEEELAEAFREYREGTFIK